RVLARRELLMASKSLGKSRETRMASTAKTPIISIMVKARLRSLESRVMRCPLQARVPDLEIYLPPFGLPSKGIIRDNVTGQSWRVGRVTPCAPGWDL